jgi:SAM-dependent methyltransferase
MLKVACALSSGDAVSEPARSKAGSTARGPDVKDDRPYGVRHFVEAYRKIRLEQGFACSDPGFAASLPFRDITGRNPRIWRTRAIHYLLVRSVLALLPGVRRVLDLGAGNGWLSRRLASSYRVTAIDVDSGETGLGSLTDDRVARLCGELEALPLRAQTFDVVIAAASVHYSADPVAVLAEIARVLRRRGVLIVADSPVYATAEARDRAWQRTLAYYESTGHPELAGRYRGLIRAELRESTSFRFVKLSPGWERWQSALERLRGREVGVRLPVLVGWKR